MNVRAHALRQLYTLAYALILPVLLTRLLIRSLKNPQYRRRLKERWGSIPKKTSHENSIWIHAVSVGETIAAVPLVKALQATYPDRPIIMTTTTPTGSAEVQKRLGNTVLHSYMPFDLPICLNHFIQRIRPALCIIMETELWPNVLYRCKKKNIPLLLANARLSEKSQKGYAKLRASTREMLTSFHTVSAQSQTEGNRFISLGLPPEKCQVNGNIKFDLELPTTLKEEGIHLRERWRSINRPTLIAASTHDGEDEIVLEAFTQIQQQHSHALLILVPRHPERFKNVFSLCKNKGFSVAKRSTYDEVSDNTQLVLGDTMGELLLLYAASNVAFVGGSFVPVGGHNLIEPAALALPVLTGPHLHNFTQISELLLNAGGARVVQDADALAKTTSALFASVEVASAMGQKGFAAVSANRGAVQKHVALIQQLLT